MQKYSAGYCNVNNNFIITNIKHEDINNNFRVEHHILSIIFNLITRGVPTIASPYLRSQFNLDRDYLNNLDKLMLLDLSPLTWSKTIKGDDSKGNYPALSFYNSLKEILNKASFIQNLAIPEYPLEDILNSNTDTFINQKVDFYIPLLKTVIEIDGSSHKDPIQVNLDIKRDQALSKANIRVIRISTKDIYSNNYEHFLIQLREAYKNNKEMVKQYEDSLTLDLSNYKTQIKLTEIVRLQILILELFITNKLSFKQPNIHFVVKDANEKHSLELAIFDLTIWINNISQFFNKSIKFPTIKIFIEHENNLYGVNESKIYIDIDIFKRWDEESLKSNVYTIRTDYIDEVNYRRVKITEPITYNLSKEKHQDSLLFIANTIFGYDNFNSGQLDIILNCLNGNDTIGLLPTGGGKSFTYQICTLLQPAFSYVIVPIKSLMMDQIDNLVEKHFIDNCSYINSDLEQLESEQRLRDFSRGCYLFLIIAPERFQTEKFREKIQILNQSMAFAFAVIDEAHCLSEWGHDFRTSYLVLPKTIKKLTPSTRFIALTATASSKVLLDLQIELEIDSQNIKTISDFTRKELYFEVFHVKKQDKNDYLIELIKNYHLINSERGQLVFTSFVDGENGCYSIHDYIKSHTNLLTAFYSGRSPKHFNLIKNDADFSKFKETVQRDFIKNKIDVVVATKAFGMGIDKPNIGQVIHYGIPSSLESYYQEAGRAGRDKKQSNCIILYEADILSEHQMDKLFGTETDLIEFNNQSRKLKGDVKAQLHFLKLGLTEVTEEADKIYKFYISTFEDSESHNKIKIPYSDSSLSEYQKCIYKLTIIGVIKDWTIEWNSKHIQVVLNNWTIETIYNDLLAYIRKYDFSFTLNIQEPNATNYIEYINLFKDNSLPYLYRIIFVLSKWYNDNVIYSRKQALLNMRQFVDNFVDSDDFQRKLELYFKRNDDVYTLDLIITSSANLVEWINLFLVKTEGKPDKFKPITSFEALGITLNRYLESYQLNTGINLVAGLIQYISPSIGILNGKQLLRLALKDLSNLEFNEKQVHLINLLKLGTHYLSLDQLDDYVNFISVEVCKTYEEYKFVYHLYPNSKTIYSILIKELNKKLVSLSKEGYPWEK